jgi:pimeloyl-ACP methyl ester carboxylesterase
MTGVPEGRRARLKVWHRRIRILWVTGGLAFTAWIIWNMQAHGVPAAARESSPLVSVREGDGATVFLPEGAAADRAGLVFLPGGAVDPAAYLPFVRAVADAGWPVALVRLPWRMAFSESAQIEVWRRVTEVRRSWGASRPIVLGGHSRGAAMSATFAGRYSTALSGLLLIGTTHPRDDDLSSLTIPVLKVVGTRDCVADAKDSLANLSKLPPHTAWLTIEGANHAQFGYYGSQLGDCRAEISRESQHQQVLDSVLSWLMHQR